MARDARAELADRLHSAAIHLLRRVRRTDRRTGVPAAQLSALSVLMHGPRTVGELAAAEQVRPPTMTRLVQELERAGLARREPDAKDRRVVRIRSTPKGERVLARGRELRIAELERRLARLSPRERADLTRGVEIVERLVRDE
ncbi:MAG TPA: MarR family transcriptional regulator [Candidatus Limnocylindria bacterium]|nr:MarR family transcriptional regulator [Candidatus Limnocylindria bacterium]